jgi:hypothetical protein
MVEKRMHFTPRVSRAHWTGVVLGLVLVFASAPPVVSRAQASTLAFGETPFTVIDPAFIAYFRSRGGLATFGYPVTNAFQLLGFKTQIFQRRAMQMGPDGTSRLLNVLDDGLLPYTSINGSTFPAADPALARAAPAAGAPDYVTRALALIHRQAPNDFAGQPVGFYDTFNTSVTCDAAFGDVACDMGLLELMDLEMWGLPTSAPQADPANSSFIYQRFQRGIMHYDAACRCTRAVLLGTYLKDILAGGNLPDDLLGQAKSSPLYGAAVHGLASSDFAGSGVPLLAATAPLAAPSTIQASLPAPTPSLVPGRTVDFGVVVSDPRSDQDVEFLLNQLGVRGWYSFGDAVSPIEPAGLMRVRLLRTGKQAVGRSNDVITAFARSHPGRAWMIGNEPNVPGQDDATPEAYARMFHDFYSALKAGDASAVVVGPNVLNWDFTCDGCPGYTSGHAWVDGFRAAYRRAYGSEPPVDVWGVHAYDIDWQHLPMVRIDHAQNDLEALHDYLQSIPEHAGKPIWLTEFGIIWAFDGAESLTFDGANQIRPAGAYATEQVDDNLGALVDWLRAQGPRLNIRRAFLYATRPPAEPYASVAAGITLFDGPGTGGQLTATGRAYRDAIHH